MTITGFHWTRPSDHQPGHIISKGRWGRIVLSTPISHPNGAKEILIEKVRRENYPESPSRLSSIFLCCTLESAYAFGTYRKSDTLYEVESTIEEPNYQRTHYNLISIRKSASYDEILEMAERYWSTTDFPSRMCEIILDSDVRVIRRVELPNNFWRQNW